MHFDKGQTILFIGDSITDCGRRLRAAPYGDGFMNIARCMITARYPELGLRFINRGISGNTVRDLAVRWQRDVISERPDWLVLMIGINDVWRAFAGNRREAVPLPEYTTTLRRLVHEARNGGARLVLMEPYLIEPRRDQAMRREMDRFSAAVDAIATETQALLVRTQAAWDAALTDSTPDDWASDQIHPNQPGHTVIALELLRTIGFEL